MNISNNKPVATTAQTWHYSTTAIILHWGVAILIIALLGLGWYMMEIEHQPGSEKLFALHKSLGFTVLGLILFRIVWRAFHRPERLPDSVPAWQAKISILIHWALYVCMVIMPVTGYLGASYQKQPPRFFGLATPIWAIPNHDIAEQYFTVHGTIAWVLVAFIIFHTLAGLKHLLIDKDHVFDRMWF